MKLKNLKIFTIIFLITVILTACNFELTSQTQKSEISEPEIQIEKEQPQSDETVTKNEEKPKSTTTTTATTTTPTPTTTTTTTTPTPTTKTTTTTQKTTTIITTTITKPTISAGIHKDGYMNVVTPLSDINKFSVFWGYTGDRVHIKPDCNTFKNGVLFGSLDTARNAERYEWCGTCSRAYRKNGDGYWGDEKFLSEGNPNIK